MRQKFEGDIVSLTNTQKVLSSFAEDPYKEFLASEIKESAGLSKAGIYRALDELAAQELIIKQERGRFILYKLASRDCVVRQYKVLKTVIALKKLVEKLKPSARKIILFGSAARGEDYKDSDLDLFIVSKVPEESQKVIVSFKSKRKIQAVIKTAVELAEMEENNKVFYREVNCGVVLWEEIDEQGV